MTSRIGYRSLGAGATLAIAALVACSGSAQPGDMASKYVKTVKVGPEGATIRVTESDDPTIAGTSLTIPAHALSESTTISIGVSTVSVVSKAAAGSTSIGPVIDFEPSGTTFGVPATMTLPVVLPQGTSTAHVLVEAVEADGSARTISAEYAGGLATLEIGGFTSFGPIMSGSDSGAACSSDADCPTGESCNAGVCTAETDAGVDAEPDAFGNCTKDTDCALGEVCLDGRCATLTDAGIDASSDGPVDASPDATDATDAATDAIVCPGGETNCGGTCVDTNTDPANCGICGHRCPSGICSAGVCS
jgi:Cys-rich repeat protein